jgi:hypothetical protein
MGNTPVHDPVDEQSRVLERHRAHDDRVQVTLHGLRAQREGSLQVGVGERWPRRGRLPCALGQLAQTRKTLRRRLERGGDLDDDGIHGAPCGFGASVTPPSHGSAPPSTHPRSSSGREHDGKHTPLLNVRGANAKIAAEITGWKQEWVKVGEETPVHDALTFLEHHRGRLDYARARRAGCPVGSGAVEATCKSLIAVRMKRAGARWKQPSADRIIQLRALALSDRWGDAMGLTLGHLRRQVLAA